MAATIGDQKVTCQSRPMNMNKPSFESEQLALQNPAPARHPRSTHMRVKTSLAPFIAVLAAAAFLAACNRKPAEAPPIKTDIVEQPAEPAPAPAPAPAAANVHEFKIGELSAFSLKDGDF